MILSPFISNITYEISDFLSKNPKFFEEDKGSKESSIKKLAAFKEIKAYLLDSTADEFLTDLKQAVDYLMNPSQTNPKNNKFLVACGNFFVNNFAEKLDLIDAKFTHLSQSKKLEYVDDLIQSDSRVAKALKTLILDYSHQEIYEEISTFLKEVSATPYVIIQTPVEINSKFKKEIRQEISKQTKHSCLPIYQVNKAIIGGMRIFIDGEVQDNSWLARINFITQISSQ